MDITDLRSHAANEKLGFSIFSSYELLQFAYLDGENCPQLPYLGKLLGEVFFRKCKIYTQHSLPNNLHSIVSTTQFSELTRFMSGNRGSKAAQEWLLDAVNYYEQRKKIQDNASGVFPLLMKEHDEALPVPFQITESMDAKVFDSCDPPNEIPAWSNVLHQIRESVNKPLLCFKILTPIGKINNDIGGSSLMLPVILASHDMLIRPTSTSFLASGKVANGVIEKVGGLKKKEQLSNAMGLVFISLDSEFSTDWPVPKLNEDLKSFLERWDNFHEEKGIEDIKDPQKAVELVEKWERHIEFRGISSEKCVKLFKTAIESIENSDTEMLREEAWRAKLCLGRALNHIGKTEAASSLLKEVTATLQGHQCRELITSMTSFSVSLTSQGRFELAEQTSRSALDFARKLKTGTRVEKNIEIARAYGCLGGTVLFQQGTWDEKKKIESCEKLENAIELIESHTKTSKGTSNPEILDHWAMDFCQLQQWHALFEPESFLETYQETQNKLVSRLPENLLNNHFPYMTRCRWMAAYRCLIQGLPNPSSWEDWELPMPVTSDQKWLLALALKSRGCLLAISGKGEEADSTFKEAIYILDNGVLGKLPLLMAGSTCLSAKILLKENAFAGYFSNLGIEFFVKLERDGFCKNHPRLSPALWKSSFNEKEIIKTPQKHFVY